MRSSLALALLALAITSASVLRSLKSLFTKPNCHQYLLSPHHDRLLHHQLALQAKHAMPEWRGGPEFTAAQVRTAAQQMHAVNIDPTHRRLVLRKGRSIYISFKFFLPKRLDQDSLLSGRVTAYGEADRNWRVVKAALKMSPQVEEVICSGFGTGGQVAVLTAVRILVFVKRKRLAKTVKVITFDDEPVFLNDPDTSHLMRLPHLRFHSNKMPRDGGCTHELFQSGANTVAMPKERFNVRLQLARIPNTIDYAMFFTPADLNANHSVSVGQRENDLVDAVLRVSAAHQALAVPIYSATSQLVMTERARESAFAFAHHLNRLLRVNKRSPHVFTCQAEAYSSVYSRFTISCRLGETQTVFDFLAHLSFNPHMTRRVARDLMQRQNLYQSGAPGEQCILALKNGSTGVQSLLFEAHNLQIDNDRMTVVIVSLKPLVMGQQLLEAHSQLLTALLTPTDPFPCQCKNLITGIQAQLADPKLWAIVRSFLRTLPPTTNPDGRMLVGKMACKRDSRLFSVMRTSFSLDRWESVRLRMDRLRNCLSTTPALDCRDPLNHWVRPVQCPKRCLRSSVSLCDNVIACPISSDMAMFVAVEPTPFQWINGGWLGRLDGRVKASRGDRYVAFHVKSLENGFGWWDLKSEFHLLFSFERH